MQLNPFGAPVFQRKIVSQTKVPLQFNPFSLSFNSPFSKELRLAVASFQQEQNRIKIFRIVGPSIIEESEAPVKFPQTSCLFSSIGSNDSFDSLITCGDTLKLWKISLDGINLMGEIDVSTTKDPITCQDWSLYDQSLVIVGSCNGSVTAVDLMSGQVVTRIIAHDHPIHDIQFCGPTSFITVDFDGSMRLFDLRDLQSSFIYYQSAMPLMRVSVSPIDNFKVATFSKDSNYVVVIDTRRSGVPCGFCNEHIGNLTCLKWSNMIDNVLFTSDNKGYIYQSSMAENIVKLKANMINQYELPIESFNIGQNLIAATCEKQINIMEMSVNQNRIQL
ncbi:protein TRANSPARENT TESTA GLABRA 1-like [Histomonas meleagridis]|uniref:protein TRANSPARENT TESTA GLABRA 1-like n=1 Tax=Histomonas meleagridis TaxID=135588 RepID=UPI003559CE0D|nr:protein TRANSPARENT TESTA GLABRA 1-like [Histomonas meleagridis]KAH0806649.1 protein TRANSPARENT TESTA GLABRA 1-like [Histomonas meleagridis]